MAHFGGKLACLRTAIVSVSGRISARRPPLTPIRGGNKATQQHSYVLEF